MSQQNYFFNLLPEYEPHPNKASLLKVLKPFVDNVDITQDSSIINFFDVIEKQLPGNCHKGDCMTFVMHCYSIGFALKDFQKMEILKGTVLNVKDGIALPPEDHYALLLTDKYGKLLYLDKTRKDNKKQVVLQVASPSYENGLWHHLQTKNGSMVLDIWSSEWVHYDIVPLAQFFKEFKGIHFDNSKSYQYSAKLGSTVTIDFPIAKGTTEMIKNFENNIKIVKDDLEKDKRFISFSQFMRDLKDISDFIDVQL